MSVYQKGFEVWEVFDNLPRAQRDAHNVVWIGGMRNIPDADAKAITDLDGGKMMLAADDVGM
jgi:hypothetical protein